MKLAIIGDRGVGKSNIFTRFYSNSFEESYVATIGVYFSVKTIPIEDKNLRMQIWDTAGPKRS